MQSGGSRYFEDASGTLALHCDLLRVAGLLVYTIVKGFEDLTVLAPRIDEKNTWNPAALVASGEEGESA
jgi:hypothetical protein